MIRVSGRQRLQRESRSPLISPPPPIGTDYRVERRVLRGELQSDRARAGDDVRMRVRRDVDAAAVALERLRLTLRFVVTGAGPQLRAAPDDRVDLRARRLAGTNTVSGRSNMPAAYAIARP